MRATLRREIKIELEKDDTRKKQWELELRQTIIHEQRTKWELEFRARITQEIEEQLRIQNNDSDNSISIEVEISKRKAIWEMEFMKKVETEIIPAAQAKWQFEQKTEEEIIAQYKRIWEESEEKKIKKIKKEVKKDTKEKYKHRRHSKSKVSYTKEEQAVILIQSYFRGVQVRKHVCFQKETREEECLKIPYIASGATTFSSQKISLRVTIQQATGVNKDAKYLHVPQTVTITIREKQENGQANVRFSKVCQVSEFGFAEGVVVSAEAIQAKVEAVFQNIKFTGDFTKDFSSQNISQVVSSSKTVVTSVKTRSTALEQVIGSIKPLPKNLNL